MEYLNPLTIKANLLSFMSNYIVNIYFHDNISVNISIFFQLIHRN